MTTDQAQALGDWVAAKGGNLTDIFIKLACELGLPERSPGLEFQNALGRVWQQRLRDHDDERAWTPG